MKVRYGKPIKVKSLLGKQNIFSTISSTGGGYSYGTKLDGSFLGGWNNALKQNVNSKWINLTANHKYLCYVGLNATNIYRNVYNGVVFLTSDSILRGNADDNPFGLGYSVTCITPSSSVSVIPMIQNYHDYWTIGDTIKEMVVLDLTDIYGSGNELTATQFYNKYNKYFSLIASGREVVIDDKRGNVNLLNQHTLPSSYQEVEYIEGDGNQRMQPFRLDKAYTGNLTVGYKFTVNVHNDAMYFSTITANLSAGQAYSLGYTTASSSLFIRWNQIANDTTKVAYTIPEICEVSRTNAVENVTLGEVSLFAHSASYKPWKGKIYKYWLKIDDEYIFNLVPCYRKSDNKPGLYNLVNHRFHVNAGTGEFVLGPAVSLPSEYQQVEYISTTTPTGQYIEYPCIPSYNRGWKFEIGFNPTDTTSRYALTANYNVGNYQVSLELRANGKARLWCYNGSKDFDSSNSYIANQLNEASFSYSSGTATIVLNGVTTTSSANYNTVCSSPTMYLFLDKAKRTTTFTKPIKIYYLRAYDGTTLTFNLIPCYRKSDNVIGMFDLVNRQFYVNKGTGTFLKGNNVNTITSCRVSGGSSDIYYGYNQLLNPITSTTTNAGITGTFNGTNLSRSYSGTSTGSAWCQLGSYRHVANKHKYLFLVNVDLTGTSMYYAPLGGGTCKDSCVYQSNRTTDESDYLVVPKDAVADISNLITQVIDLTDWFGEGKEPSTVAEFKEKFAKDYYGFCSTPIKLTRYQIEALPTYGYNQLATIQEYSSRVVRGITYTSTSKDIIFNGTGTGQGNANFDKSGITVDYILGHKYLLKFLVDGTQTAQTNISMQYRVGISVPAGTYSNQEFYNIQECTKDAGSGNHTFCINNFGPTTQTYTNFKISNYMFIDLTDWYGAGDEPTTIAEFKATFPNLYYIYSKKRLLNKYMINKLSAN